MHNLNALMPFSYFLGHWRPIEFQGWEKKEEKKNFVVAIVSLSSKLIKTFLKALFVVCNLKKGIDFIWCRMRRSKSVMNGIRRIDD